MIIKFILVLFLVSSQSLLAVDFSEEYLKKVSELRDSALTDSTAYDLTESLTTEVGHRLAGSANDAKAVAWAIDKFKQLGFDKVYSEPVTFRKWTRGLEQAEVLAPFAHEIKITALGRSHPTPQQGITAEIVHFETLKDLQEAEPSTVKGKITFISNRMQRAKDGSGYGKANGARYLSAFETAKKGGVGAIIRSIGTDNNRDPHTGGMKSYEIDEATGKITDYSDKQIVPAGAISNPDADLLLNILKRGKAVKFKMTLLSHWDGDYTSANVIGEITGNEKADEVVVIGGHLDSWDLGTGAIDDASGCAITMAAASLIKKAELKPLRTIRVVLWANEEYGLHGANAYAKAHKNEMQKHIIGAESDFGAAPVYAFASHVSEKSLTAVAQMAELLAPIGVAYVGNKGRSGADISPLKKVGMATMGLYQDGQNYFDLHHTADDTMDKIVPEEIAQNVAAWVVFVSLAAHYPSDFGFGL